MIMFGKLHIFLTDNLTFNLSGDTHANMLQDCIFENKLICSHNVKGIKKGVLNVCLKGENNWNPGFDTTRSNYLINAQNIFERAHPFIGREMMAEQHILRHQSSQISKLMRNCLLNRNIWSMDMSVRNDKMFHYN